MTRILIYKKNNLIGGSGGAENVICSLANGLSTRNEVCLATRDKNSGVPFYHLNKGVAFKRLVIHFSFLRMTIYRVLKMFNLLGRFGYFDRELAISNQLEILIKDFQPEVIIASGLPEIVDLLYNKNYNIPIVLMIHSYPDVYFKVNDKKLKTYLEMLNKISVVQVLLPSFVDVMRKVYAGRIEVIGNGIKKFESETQERGQNTIIYIARVRKSKQQDLLIRAFAKIAADYKDWKLEFYGDIKDSEYYPKCQKLINENKLENQVYFRGVTSTPNLKFLQADICAFPSSYEGFGMSMVEAMSVCLPVVGMSYCTGVNEIIEDGVNGYLVKDEDEMAEKLRLLIDNPELRKQLGEAAEKTSASYREDIILEKWINLLDSLTA